MQAQLESCEAKRTSTVWRKESPGSAAGPWLHCAHYAWQAGAREGDPSAAGILGAKLVSRIREETLHFVPGDDLKNKNKIKKNRGGLKILNQNFKAQKSNFVSLLWNQKL